jgi:NAD(P)-dependent dehydrogenase (short-subunit alcohol dehydrogenase family)
VAGVSGFDGAVVLVAGGTGALGGAVCRGFVAAGATVVCTYRNPEGYAHLAAMLGADATRLDGQRADLVDQDSTRQLVDGIMTRHRRLDAVVNAIGGYVGGSRTWEVAAADFERMLDLNLRSAWQLVRAVVPVLLSQGRGSLVNVSARAALDPPAGAAAYAASKAAVLALMNALAAELLGTGVRANSVLPSTIDTPANRRDMPKADFTRWPAADDIARVIVFLCSNEARVIHGASIPVYGNR